MLAVFHDEEQVVRLLLDYGVDVNYVAIDVNHVLEHFSTPHPKDYKVTAISLSRDPVITQLLIQAGAKK